MRETRPSGLEGGETGLNPDFSPRLWKRAAALGISVLVKQHFARSKEAAQ